MMERGEGEGGRTQTNKLVDVANRCSCSDLLIIIIILLPTNQRHVRNGRLRCLLAVLLLLLLLLLLGLDEARHGQSQDHSQA